MPTSQPPTFDSQAIPTVPARSLAAARSLAGRVRLVRTLTTGALGFAIGSAVAAALLVASTRLPEWHTIAPWIGGGIALLGLIAGGAVGWRRVISDSAGAGRADAALGLHDRLTTAVELSEELKSQTSDRPRPFAGVLYAEAESAAASVRPNQIIPMRFDRAWAVGAACLVLGVAGWMFLPVRTPPPRGPLAGATPESIQEADDAIRETIESLERDPAQDESLAGAGRDGEPDGVADELSAIRERLERGEVRPEDALAEAANELERAAARAEEESADPASDAIADAARESAEDLSAESTELAEALASGDLERARDAARDLMRDAEGMPPEARERIAEDLARLADAIDASNLNDEASGDRPTPSDELTEALREKAGDLTDEQRVAEALENEGVDPTSARELAEQIAREERDRDRRARAREDAERLRDALKDASRDLSDRPAPEAPTDSSSEEPDANPNEPQRETGRDETGRDPTEQPGDTNTPGSEEQPGTDEQPGRDDRTGPESPVDAPRDPTDRSPERESGERGAGEQGTGEKRADEQGQPQPTEGAGDQQSERQSEGDSQTPQERQPGEQPSDQPADQPGDQPGEQPAETQNQQPGEQPGQQEGEQQEQRPGDQPGEQPGQQPGQQEVEQQGQQSGQESGQQGEQSGKQPGEQAGDQAGDRAEGQPVDGEPRGEGQPGRSDQDATGETEPTREGGTGDGAGEGGRDELPDERRGLDRLSEELDRLAESQKERRARRRESEDMRRRAQELLDKATPEERERLKDLAEEFAERNPDRFPPSGQRPGAPYDAASETVDARDPDNADPTGPEQTLSEWFNPEGKPVEGVDRSERTPEALRDAAESAERAVEQQRVPPRYRRLVREVFKNMRERADAEQRGAPAELGEDASKSGTGESGSQNDSSKKDGSSD
jgi:hypothetical protein